MDILILSYFLLFLFSYEPHILIIFLAVAFVLNFLTSLLLETLYTPILSPTFFILYGIINNFDFKKYTFLKNTNDRDF